MPGRKEVSPFIALDKADFIYPPDRSNRYTIVEFSLFEGRSVEAKKLLVRRLYQHVRQLTGISPKCPSGIMALHGRAFAA